MVIFFLILIVLASVILGFLVLVQNPKGGGLSGTIGGFNNQFMGVKQTNDVLEKGTWLFATIIGVLSIVSVLFFRGSAGTDNSMMQQINTNTAPVSTPIQQQQQPANTTTLPDSARH